MNRTNFLKLELSRFGVILSNYAILGMIITLSSILTILLYGVTIVFWLVLLLGTLGMILLINPNYMNFFSDNFLTKMIEFITPCLPYVYWITFATAALSLVFMFLGYGKKPIGHIVFSIITCALCLLFILGAIGG